MQAKELSSISIAPLVVTPFASQWSEDDHISLITEKGVHVFEVVPSPTCPHPIFKFVRTFIYPSEILPAQKFAADVESVLWKLDREEVYSLLMEEALTPQINGATDMVPKVTSVAWSPCQLMHSCKCLLAIVTTTGAVEILFKISKDWLSACDLSTTWLEAIYESSNLKHIHDLDKTEQYDVLKKCLRRVQSTAIVWSDLHKLENGCFAYLVSTYRSSDIVIWRVPGISYSSQDMAPSIMFSENLKTDSKINVLKWKTLKDNKYLIVIGYFDGRVDGLIVEFAEGKFTKKSLERYWSHSDHISVSCIEFWKQDEPNIRVVTSKGYSLVLFQLSYDGILEDTYYVQIDGFFITGIVEINNSQLMVTTQNGGLFAVTLQERHLTYECISHDMPHSRVQYLGLASSLNKAMFLNITSPNSMYDHLISREPSTFCMFILKGEEWDPLRILQQNKSETLRKHWDCLESLRVQAANAQNPYEILPPIPQDSESLSNYELRIAMWISVIAEVCGKKKVPRRTENMIGEISEAQPLIFLRLASARLIDLASKENLSKEQRLCANLLRSYIEVYLAGEEEDEETASMIQAKKALSVTTDMSSIVSESCDLCNEIITDLSWKVTSCPSGHKLPRCAVTLLQVSTVHYRSCPVCGQILHPCLDKELHVPLCPFCELPAMYDSRLLDVMDKGGLPLRNLSKGRTLAPQATKFQGLEKSASESSKEQSHTKRTLAVIVDNDVNEQYRITETWEEF